MHLRKSETTSNLVFGIYPGSATGTGPYFHQGPSDDPEQIKNALKQLQPPDQRFLVRTYIIYDGSDNPRNITPENPTQYTNSERKLDLVLCFRAKDNNIANWQAFIRNIVLQYGHSIEMLQITEEPNNPDATSGGDGNSANITTALIEGIKTAKEVSNRQGYPIQVGFNATPSFNPADRFWVELHSLATASFVESLDYVGLDFFPDVFQPLPNMPDGKQISMEEAVSGVISHFRNVNLPTGKIPATVPLHITEHGWPTNENRSYEKQADIISKVIHTINRVRLDFNITHYEFFNLRDTNSHDGSFQFGLLRDDYTPKPAFATYRQLILELS